MSEDEIELLEEKAYYRGYVDAVGVFVKKIVGETKTLNDLTTAFRLREKLISEMDIGQALEDDVEKS